MRLFIPIRPRPTPRPRARKGQPAYYPNSYQTYRDELLWRIREARNKAGEHHRFTGPVTIDVIISKEGFDVTITEGHARSRGLRGDVDNIYKGLADGLQKAGIVNDDNQINEAHITIT